ncbi:cytochrome b561 and DOMON domain-containing protein At5g35735-like [Syzygium oleosum]|uniref:cytochrome b561 and DOMON domain-containing protein At5g35735-like n=1 Tax=Syzygium oleosum TaxID=219896 RepID=UPI0011D1B140|nr:cytochrome b561 and DOMON domain-containing protein At5g35735-like [Syzygium oleosum]
MNGARTGSPHLALLSLALLSPFLAPSLAQTCQSQSHAFSGNRDYASCAELPVLSSYLHWNYNETSNVADIAFRVTGVTSSNWLSWAINPAGQQMVGSQALVAYQNSSGSMWAYTSSVDSYQTCLTPGNLSFGVPNISAVLEGSDMTIFATLQLSSGMTTVNQVWQVGPMEGGSPGTHLTSGDNIESVGTLDFLSGIVAGSGGLGSSRQRRRNVHGVLNAVSWGTLMPMGALIARYLKVFQSADPAWFYLHISCQASAYAVGVAGWATGLKLGNESSANNKVHGNIGLALFVLGTIQGFALLLRPKKDHKYRLYWNVYHHTVGYTVIVLSIVNVFKGLDIQDPEQKWRTAYIGIVAFLGAGAAILEAVTWYIVIKRKKTASSTPKISHSINGDDGYNNGRA